MDADQDAGATLVDHSHEHQLRRRAGTIDNPTSLGGDADDAVAAARLGPGLLTARTAWNPEAALPELGQVPRWNVQGHGAARAPPRRRLRRLVLGWPLLRRRAVAGRWRRRGIAGRARRRAIARRLHRRGPPLPRCAVGWRLHRRYDLARRQRGP